MKTSQTQRDRSIEQPFKGKTIKKIQGFIEIKDVCLGQGGYGRVFACWDNQNNQALAVKVISKERVLARINARSDPIKKKEFYIQSFKNEVLIMISLHHPNILQLRNYLESKTSLYFFTEYCNQGYNPDLFSNLEEKIGRERFINYHLNIRLFQDLIQACQYLHKQKIVHRDIKPSNILLHNGVAKLCDFGFAVRQSQQTKIEDDYIVGTLEYMAPEAILKQKVDEKSDVWSLGVTFYEMLYGHLPWTKLKQKEDILKLQKKPIILPLEALVPSNVKIALRRMLTYDRAMRASIEEVGNIFGF